LNTRRGFRARAPRPSCIPGMPGGSSRAPDREKRGYGGAPQSGDSAALVHAPPARPPDLSPGERDPESNENGPGLPAIDHREFFRTPARLAGPFLFGPPAVRA